MTTQLAAFKQEVNNLAEVFSEVEQDLDPNVYKLFSGPLNKVMENMQTCSDHMDNMAAVMRLMGLLSKRPDIKLSLRNIDLWEERFASGRRAIPDGAMLEPLEPPPEEEEEEEEERERARPTVAARPAAPQPFYDDTWAAGTPIGTGTINPITNTWTFATAHTGPGGTRVVRAVPGEPE